jgi:hypothetical protein
VIFRTIAEIVRAYRAYGPQIRAARRRATGVAGAGEP